MYFILIFFFTSQPSIKQQQQKSLSDVTIAYKDEMKHKTHNNLKYYLNQKLFASTERLGIAGTFLLFYIIFIFFI